METIREYLTKRQVLARILGWLSGVAIAYSVFRFKLGWGPFGTYAVAILAIAVCAMWLLEQRLVRCPRCERALSGSMVLIGMKTITACPGCGVNLDERR
jgi:hypothetical protein